MTKFGQEKGVYFHMTTLLYLFIREERMWHKKEKSTHHSSACQIQYNLMPKLKSEREWNERTLFLKL